MTPARARLVKALANTAILVFVSAGSLLILEFASRVLYPLPPGTAFRNSAGEPVEVFRSDVLLAPNQEFYQISPDFSVLSHTGPLGLRAPEPIAPPEIVFLGDSFTFGQGLADDQTFPAIFCRQMSATCANLGFPGTGTFRQMAILEHWVVEVGWRPAQVNLFVFAMASGLGAGNDLFDTETEIRAARNAAPGGAAQPKASPESGEQANGVVRWLAANRQWLRVKSNLVRIIIVQTGPSLRKRFLLEASEAEKEGGIQALRSQLARLDALSREYDFAYSIYLLHPMQDLMRQTQGATAEAVQAAAPSNVDIIDTAAAMLVNPAQYYFPFDGHFNSKGAQAIAQFLLDRRGV